MKLKKIIPLSLLLFFSLSISVFGQNPKNEELKKEALEFSLSIFQTFFTKDCEDLISKIDSNMYSIDDDEIFSLEEIKADICESLEDALEDESKTFQDYLLDYNYQVLTKKEFLEEYEKAFGKLKTENFELQNSTFFFFGTKTKSPQIKEYIWCDLEVFAVQKVNGKWLIVGGME